MQLVIHTLIRLLGSVNLWSIIHSMFYKVLGIMMSKDSLIHGYIQMAKKHLKKIHYEHKIKS